MWNNVYQCRLIRHDYLFALLWGSELVSCELLVTIESTMWVRGNLTKYHYIINSSNIKFCWGSFCWNEILEITVNFDWHLWWQFFLLSCLMSTVMLWKRHLTVFCVWYIVMADTMLPCLFESLSVITLQHFSEKIKSLSNVQMYFEI